MFQQTKYNERVCHWNQKQLNVIKVYYNISGQSLNRMNFYNGIGVQSMISLANEA